MKAAGMIKVDRQNSQIARKSINNAIEILSNTKLSMLIYPEGTRSQSSRLKEFKKGGFILAIQNQFPVVPMSIIGAGTSLPKGSININSKVVKIVFSPPILTNKMNLEDKENLIQMCREKIEQNIGSYSYDLGSDFDMQAKTGVKV